MVQVLNQQTIFEELVSPQNEQRFEEKQRCYFCDTPFWRVLAKSCHRLKGTFFCVCVNGDSFCITLMPPAMASSSNLCVHAHICVCVDVCQHALCVQIDCETKELSEEMTGSLNSEYMRHIKTDERSTFLGWAEASLWPTGTDGGTTPPLVPDHTSVTTEV